MYLPHPKFSMHNFRPNPTHIPNIIKVGHTVPEICSGQKTMDGGRQTADGTRRTDIWITKPLPELSSGETKTHSGKLLYKTYCLCAVFENGLHICNVLLNGISKEDLKRLQKQKNKRCTSLCFKPTFHLTLPLLNQLHWLLAGERIV